MFGVKSQDLQTKLPPSDSRRLYPAVLSPQSLRHRIEYLTDRRASASIDLTYRGEHHQIANIAGSPEFSQWLQELPGQVLFQRSLAIEKGQPCTH